MREWLTGDPGHANKKHPSLRLARASADQGGDLSKLQSATSASTIESVSQHFEKANPDSPGLLLLDTLRRPLYVNEEAVSILCYPESPPRNESLGYSLVRTIDSLLPKQVGSLCSQFPNEFASGKRRYQVQVFKMNSYLEKGTGPTLAMMLERNQRAALDLSRISQKFRLTPRETEALKLLMQGYTTKLIASRMHISPNTAKTFLRFVMFKTGAYDRSGVLAKILQLSKDDAVNQAHPYERLMAI